MAVTVATPVLPAAPCSWTEPLVPPAAMVTVVEPLPGVPAASERPIRAASELTRVSSRPPAGAGAASEIVALDCSPLPTRTLPSVSVGALPTLAVTTSVATPDTSGVLAVMTVEQGVAVVAP